MGRNMVTMWIKMQALAARLGVSLGDLLKMDASAVKIVLERRGVS